jgi:hypothetical protein
MPSHVKARTTTLCPFCQRRVRNDGYEQHLDMCRTADSVAQKCSQGAPLERKEALKTCLLTCTTCGKAFEHGYNPAEGVLLCPPCFMRRA